MKLVAIEGIDASGKRTQTFKAADYLIKKGLTIDIDAFPRYYHPIGSLIRNWLYGELPITDEAAHMLYEADRQDFMQTLKDIENDTDVIFLDRFTMSNLAFGIAKGLDIEWLRNLQDKVRQPDITIFIDVSPEISMERSAKRGFGQDKNEKNAQLLSDARMSYFGVIDALQREGETIYVIDGEQDPESIHQQIKKVLDYHLSL